CALDCIQQFTTSCQYRIAGRFVFCEAGPDTVHFDGRAEFADASSASVDASDFPPRLSTTLPFRIERNCLNRARRLGVVGAFFPGTGSPSRDGAPRCSSLNVKLMTFSTNLLPGTEKRDAEIVERKRRIRVKFRRTDRHAMEVKLQPTVAFLLMSLLTGSTSWTCLPTKLAGRPRLAVAAAAAPIAAGLALRMLVSAPACPLHVSSGRAGHAPWRRRLPRFINKRWNGLNGRLEALTRGRPTPAREPLYPTSIGSFETSQLANAPLTASPVQLQRSAVQPFDCHQTRRFLTNEGEVSGYLRLASAATVWMSDEDRPESSNSKQNKRPNPASRRRNRQNRGSNAKLGKRQRFRQLHETHEGASAPSQERLLNAHDEAKLHGDCGVQRFDRLRRLGLFESETAASAYSRSSGVLQRRIQSCSGKHESGRPCAHPRRMASNRRANLGSTGPYTVSFAAKCDARYRLLYRSCPEGVEPYGESSSPALDAVCSRNCCLKANLEVYTRWMDQTRACRAFAPAAVSVRSLRLGDQTPSETPRFELTYALHFSEFSFGPVRRRPSYTTVSPPPCQLDV
uniref:Apple domain-containing protein n=1 Tax=Macrostomum lignano TaxID=282301 RepID=A0A1I8FBK4_9PLAT